MNENDFENCPDFSDKDSAIKYWKELAITTRRDYDDYTDISKQMEQDQEKELETLDNENKSLKNQLNNLKNTLQTYR